MCFATLFHFIPVTDPQDRHTRQLPSFTGRSGGADFLLPQVRWFPPLTRSTNLALKPLILEQIHHGCGVVCLLCKFILTFATKTTFITAGLQEACVAIRYVSVCMRTDQAIFSGSPGPYILVPELARVCWPLWHVASSKHSATTLEIRVSRACNVSALFRNACSYKRNSSARVE
jgi:hypothetical protein